MGIADRLFDGLRATIELRGDLDRTAAEVRRQSDLLLDHEKRLVRIETMIELSRGSQRRLPDDR